MLSVVVFLPVAVAAVLVAVPRIGDRHARWLWVATAAVDAALVLWLWVDFDPGPAGFDHQTQLGWIPSVSASYHVGVDGVSLPLLALTVVLFLACAVFQLSSTDRPRTQAALFLFLQTTCLGLFASLDLILFFVFFDLSIVGMYFVIAGWGHGERFRSALMFFLYTFLGSLALLLGFIGLYLAADPHTFDMVELTAQPAGGTIGALALLAVGVGLAVKTPTVPVHTWLPPAHTDAPAAGSAILAGILLKMGTYGFVRIAMPMLPQEWRRYALVVVVVGVVSALYGALVALAQKDFKRMVAYTSVNHMGYVILAVGAAGLGTAGDAAARELAISGAVTQMVSHGLITGSLFLLSGVMYARVGHYRMAEYGGVAGQAPRFSALLAVAAFASLGLPGLAGFIAEFQIFTGSIGTVPVGAAAALPGILITAALFLRALHRVLLGDPHHPDISFADLRPAETLAVAPLLAATVVIGIAPRFLLEVIEPAARTVVDLVAR